MFQPVRYKVAPTLDTGLERLILDAQNLPYEDMDGTGEQVSRTLSPGSRGFVTVYNTVLDGLPGLIVPGMFTQPLTVR